MDLCLWVIKETQISPKLNLGSDSHSGRSKFVEYTYLSANQDNLKVADFCLKETITMEINGGCKPSPGMIWMSSYLRFFPELNWTSLFHNIEPSGAQYSLENSRVNLLITFAYSTWNCSFFSLALWPSGSIMSV